MKRVKSSQVAQLVMLRPVKASIVGSNPTLGAILNYNMTELYHWDQLKRKKDHIKIINLFAQR